MERLKKGLGLKPAMSAGLRQVAMRGEHADQFTVEEEAKLHLCNS